MAAVPRRCARTGARFLIRKRVRRYDSSHPSLADTLKDLGDQAKYSERGSRGPTGRASWEPPPYPLTHLPVVGDETTSAHTYSMQPAVLGLWYPSCARAVVTCAGS